MLGVNPDQRGMPDLNSHIREMMQNPELLRMLSSPETMQVDIFFVVFFSMAKLGQFDQVAIYAYCILTW